MAGFFKDRWNGLKHGLGMMFDGGARILKQGFGWQKVPEESPGLAGWVVESVRAAVDGLFDKNKGLLRLDQGYQLVPWEKESVWNPVRHVRRGVAAVLNTVIAIDTKWMGILSPTVGNFWSRMLQGASTTVLAPIIGDISPYLGPTEATIFNDGSYKAANSGDYNISAANDRNDTKPTPTPEPPKEEPVVMPDVPKVEAEPEKKAA